MALLPLVLMILTSCKPEVVTETKTVTVYVEKFRDYDFSNVRCGDVVIHEGQTYMEIIINQAEMNEMCVTDIKAIKDTLNSDQ